MGSRARASARRRSPSGRPARPPKKANGSRMPAASQVGAGMPIVAAWEASVTPVREREECEERRAHGPRRRAGKQQIDKHRRARLPHQRAGKARNGSGGEIKAGTHRERAPMLAQSRFTRPPPPDPPPPPPTPSPPPARPP